MTCLPKNYFATRFLQRPTRTLYRLTLPCLILAGLGACTLQTTRAASALPTPATVATVTPAATAAATPVATAATAATASVPTLPPESSFDLQREEIRNFIDEVSARHGLDRQAVQALLAEGRHQPRIIEAISRPAERVLRWWEYRERLVSAQRVQMGQNFWREHRILLQDIEARSGVDAYYIAAIIGIETNYGRNKGSWRVLDALMTLGFDYPPRSRFFRSELEHFLLLTNEEGLDPKRTLGSYAGAMGAPQFMPSSYRRFAVNHDLTATPGTRDLFDDWADVVASIANYFLAHGWQPGAPVLAEATAPPGTMATLDRSNLRLHTTLGALADAGVQVLGNTPPMPTPQSTDPSPAAIQTASQWPRETAVMLLPAELAETEQVRVGFNNFQVITRYNRSILYAMAVHDLALAIRAGAE